MNDRRDIDEIRRRLSIIDIIGEHVVLKKAGSHYKGLCPFHTEKSPSFTVNEERGLYKCFGCGEGGDIFRFVMKISGLDFPQALSHLAQKAGVTLSRKGKKKDSSWESYGEINQLAREHFSRNLMGPAGKAAREYLADRGIDKAVIESFSLGLSLDSFDDLLKSFRGKYTDQIIKDCGLFIEGKRGGGYDRFRNRIIFPILDTTGRVVGFGGRVFARDDDSPAKYINSPDTPSYTKGRHLYGLFQGKEAVKRSSQAVLVEGYTDVIIAHKHGYKNVIASLGTALTADQITLVGRFAREIILCYDADTAGQNAMEKGIDMVLDKGLTVRTAIVPPGKDPADFLEEGQPEEFGRLISGATDFIDHRIESALSKATSTIERAHAARELVASLRNVRDPLIRDTIIGTVAERFGVSEVSLRNEIRRGGDHSPVSEESARLTRAVTPTLDPELAILKLMLEEPSLRARVGQYIDGTDFSKPPRTMLFEALLEAERSEEEITGDIGGRLDDLSLQLLAYIANVSLPNSDRELMFGDYLRSVRLKSVDNKISQCSISLRSAALSEEERDMMTNKLNQLIKDKTVCMSSTYRNMDEGDRIS